MDVRSSAVPEFISINFRLSRTVPRQKNTVPGPVPNPDFFCSDISKWVEAKVTRMDDAKTVIDFVNTNIFCRYGMPRAIISDKGTHFCNKTVSALLRKYNVTHRVSTAYHPQTNGQTEVSNREIKFILEKMINPNRKD
ncbi:UNVERIFIED_CONTAM: hypothetical protein Slati_2375500 [Sesamum latifolium]|uniref:Integrase catalytic domain-containing protein n=1 Tax=Sesamum latifolium TaxID=2727402 RepID=A0AAW2WB01_9LAMI